MDKHHSRGAKGAAAVTAIRACTRAFARLGRSGKRFLASRRGNVAMIFGLAAIPMLIAAGCGVDLSRALIARQRLAHALDSAGLAVGRDLTLVTQEQMTQAAQDFFAANYPAEELGVPSEVTVTPNDDNSVVSLSATAQVDTAILRIVGLDFLTVSVSNEITRKNNGLELALVLDTTGSMAWTAGGQVKITALKSAATTLVNTLFGPNNSPNIFIGVVPFAEAVRLDPTTAVNNGWVDTNGQSSVAQLNFSGGKYAYWLYTNPGGLSGTPWLGCVEARPNGLEEGDTAPTLADPDSLFVPMFQPDEPSIREPEIPNQGGISSNYTDDYIDVTNRNFTVYSTGSDQIQSRNAFGSTTNHNMATGDGPLQVNSTATLPGGLAGGTDYWVIYSTSSRLRLATSKANALAGIDVNITSNGSGGSTTHRFSESPFGTDLVAQAAQQRNWEKYVGRTYTGTSGPYRACAMQTVLALTNDKDAILAKIDTLNPSGYTHIPLGAGWGWRVLSPTAPFTEGVAYNDDDFIKAMVLMTDGENTIPTQSSTLNGSRYTAYGYAKQARMGAGVDSASEMEAEMDASLTRVCNNIKAAGIRVYTIAFDVDTDNIRDLLEGCASDPSLYYDTPTAEELDAAFQAIAQDLSNLRLSR